MEEDENSTLGTGVVAVVFAGEVEARAKKILLAACATLCHLVLPADQAFQRVHPFLSRLGHKIRLREALKKLFVFLRIIPK